MLTPILFPFAGPAPIRQAVAKIALPNPEPEVDEAIDELVAALLSGSGKRQINR